MQEIILQNKNGKILASSRDVAEKFGKEIQMLIDLLKISLCKIAQ